MGETNKNTMVVIIMKYIFFTTYDSDAERKRIDYLLDKWTSRAKIRRVKGFVFVIEAENIEEFIEELFSRLEGNPKEKVEIYKAEEVWKKVEPQKKHLEYELKEDLRVVERFLNYLLSKLNASYSYSNALAKVYEVYTKKGRALIKVTLKEKKGNTIAILDVEGYGEVADFLAEKINDEMRIFAGD